MDAVTADQLTFRFAERADTPLVLRFIRELARYEQLEDQVVADVPTLERELFDERKPLYEKYAEVTVDVDDLSITAAARKVADAIEA